MEFFAEDLSFASFKYTGYQSHVSGFSTQIDRAIRAFQEGKLISAGNQFLDIYQAVQNTQQDILSTCISEDLYEKALRIRGLRNLEPHLVRDAALCFSLQIAMLKQAKRKYMRLGRK
jgi:hypothetical protein